MCIYVLSSFRFCGVVVGTGINVERMRMNWIIVCFQGIRALGLF